MRKGTVKWHTGKHPVVESFTPFLADLEELVGEGEVSHGAFLTIHYHPAKPEYSYKYCDTTKTFTITAKYGGFLQRFHTSAGDPDYLLILQAFVNSYPDENFMNYVVQQPVAGELEASLVLPRDSEKQDVFSTASKKELSE